MKEHPWPYKVFSLASNKADGLVNRAKRHGAFFLLGY